MSFVNLMASDVWSDADITARTEALLRAQWSVQAQTILSRKAVGVALGQFTLSPEEEEELGRFAAASFSARVAGEAAHVDMVLLRQVLEVEPCVARLALPPIELTHDEEGLVTNQAEVDADGLGRAIARGLIASAPEGVLQILAKRAATD